MGKSKGNGKYVTPEELEKRWEEYKSDTDREATKWSKIQYVGKDGRREVDEPPMPYDIDGFYVWHVKKYKCNIHQYFENGDSYSEYLGIITRIKQERNANIKTGVLLGFFNPNMGNRIVGLSENTKTEVNINKIDADFGTKS